MLRGSLIEGVPHDGIHIGSTDGVLIEDNEVREVRVRACGDHSDSVQWVAAIGVTIRRNHFHHNTHGFMVHGPNSTSRANGRLENNLMHDVSGFGFNLYSVDGLAVVNNTVWGVGTLGIRIRNEADDDTQMRATVRNNLTQAYSNECGPCVAAFEGNLVGGTPGFAAGYELAPGSPAIDRGVSTEAPTVDRLGRPRAGRPDAGAHEAQ